MILKPRFSIGLLLVGIFIGIFFYLFGQNYTRAKDPETIQLTASTSNFDIVTGLSGILKQSRKKYLTTFDLISDSSLQRYLSDENPFSDIAYKPLDLAPIVSFFTYNKSSKFQLRSPAAVAFADMAWAFQDHFDKSYKFYLVSAYRSYGSQNSMVRNGCEDTRCAEPGASEHQAGLAVDIGVAAKNGKILQMHTGSDFYKWMDENAYRYGFHNTYQKGVDIDGKMAEHRHWRFLGTPFARYLHDNNMTIAEYFRNFKF